MTEIRVQPHKQLVEHEQPAPALPHRLTSLDDVLAGFLVRFRPPTRQAYRADLGSWLEFCRQLSIRPPLD